MRQGGNSISVKVCKLVCVCGLNAHLVLTFWYPYGIN